MNERNAAEGSEEIKQMEMPFDWMSGQPNGPCGICWNEVCLDEMENKRNETNGAAAFTLLN